MRVEGGEGLGVRVGVMVMLLLLLLLLMLPNLHLRRCQPHRRGRFSSIRHEIQIQIQIQIDVERRSRRVGVVRRVHHRPEIHTHRWKSEMIEVEQRGTSRVRRVDEIACRGMMGELEDGGRRWSRS